MGLFSNIITVVGAEASTLTGLITGHTGWRPPQWGQVASPATLTMVVPNQSATAAAAGLKNTVYVFDAVVRAEHQQDVVVTENPIQTGGTIADHAYLQAAVLKIDVLMSDSMQAYSAGQWSGAATKSASAYQVLRSIQQQRIPVQVSTRIYQYGTMLITGIQAVETAETRYGGKFTVTFTQLMLATAPIVATGSVGGLSKSSSAIPQTTVTTPGGTTGASPVPQSIFNSNSLQSTAAQAFESRALPSVAGAGNWSSTNVASLTKLF